MATPTSYTARQRHSFNELHDLAWQIATRLFDESAVAEQVEQVTGEAARTFTEPSSAAAAEAWILKELVRRAERTRIEATTTRRKQVRAEAITTLPVPHWEDMHAQGALAELLAQLPRPLAEAFSLQYVERVSLREMMRRTGASAGVVTHRVAEARRRLTELTRALHGGDVTN